MLVLPLGATPTPAGMGVAFSIQPFRDHNIWEARLRSAPTTRVSRNRGALHILPRGAVQEGADIQSVLKQMQDVMSQQGTAGKPTKKKGLDPTETKPEAVKLICTFSATELISTCGTMDRKLTPVGVAVTKGAAWSAFARVRAPVHVRVSVDARTRSGEGLDLTSGLFLRNQIFFFFWDSR